MSGGTFWGSKFLLQVVFLHAYFRNLREKISELGLAFDLKGRQKSILYAQSSFATKIVFLRRIDIYRSEFRVWPAAFLTFGDKVSQGSRKVHICRPDIICARTTVFIKPILLNFFRTLMRIFLGIFGENFGGVVKSPTYVSANFLWNYIIFEGIFIFPFGFGLRTKKVFSKKYLHDWKLFFLHAQKMFLREKSFSLKRSFFRKSFPTLGDMFSEIWQTFVQQTVKLALNLSRWFWWRETRSLRKKFDCIKNFSDIRTFLEKVWQGCQNCIPCAPRNFLKQNIFSDAEQFFYWFCCFLPKIPRDYGENFGQGYQNFFTHVDGKFLWK